MSRSGEQHRFAITRLGGVADDVLRGDGVGRVAAVFDRSFYVETAHGMACIVARGLSIGPLNAISTAPSNVNWQASGLRPGARVTLLGKTVYIGGQFVFTLHDARRWQPAPVPRHRDRASVADGMGRLDTVSAYRVPGDGLGRLVFRTGAGHTVNPLLWRAVPPVGGLCSWLGRAMAGDLAEWDAPVNDVEQLLGLGPGLTPSGDDFLAGVMIALHALGQHATLQSLSLSIRRLMVDRTSAISAAHLSAAMSGTGSAAVHRLLQDILVNHGADLNADLEDIARIGHTSGWDCLAGIVATLRVWMATERDLATAPVAVVKRPGIDYAVGRNFAV